MSEKPIVKPPITTHILDTSRGQAAADVPVILFSYNIHSKQWTMIGESSTNNDGRAAFPTPAKLESGIYKLRFETHVHFEKTTTKFLYPFVEITFNLEIGQHYHIPLLLQPFGYSTYRGT